MFYRNDFKAVIRISAWLKERGWWVAQQATALKKWQA